MNVESFLQEFPQFHLPMNPLWTEFLYTVCREKRISFPSANIHTFQFRQDKVPVRTGEKILFFQFRQPEKSAGILNDTAKEYRKAFLNYTAEYPNHWICPENPESGFWDMPHNSAIFLSALLLHESENSAADEIILPYAEFLGAMQSVTSMEELPYAYLFILLAQEKYPAMHQLAEMEKKYREMLCHPVRTTSADRIFWNADGEPGYSCFPGIMNPETAE